MSVDPVCWSTEPKPSCPLTVWTVRPSAPLNPVIVSCTRRKRSKVIKPRSICSQVFKLRSVHDLHDYAFGTEEAFYLYSLVITSLVIWEASSQWNVVWFSHCDLRARVKPFLMYYGDLEWKIALSVTVYPFVENCISNRSSAGVKLLLRLPTHESILQQWL